MSQTSRRRRAALVFAGALSAAGWLVSCPSAAQVFTDFPPTEGLPKQPKEIAAGGDGFFFWFTETGMSRIAAREPSGGYFEVDMAPSVGFPTGITLGPDGNIWFVTSADRIGFVQGLELTATTFPLPDTNVGREQMITGPDNRPPTPTP